MGNRSVGVATKQNGSLSTRNRSSRVVVEAKYSKLVGKTLVIESQRRNGPTSYQLAIHGAGVRDHQNLPQRVG